MKKDNLLYIILFGILSVALFLPIIQWKTNLFPIKPLEGVTVKTELPKLNFENYCSGKLQGQTEKYIAENFGFREPIIRGYNQYVWDFFHKTYVGSIVVGKDKWLYGKEFIDDMLGQRWKEYADSPEQLTEKFTLEAERIRKVQEILAEYDKHLFVIMEPGKTRTYPEHLKKGLLDEVERRKDCEDYCVAADVYPAIFDRLGVYYINIDQWFQQCKDEVDYQLYPQTGTHWSNLAALHATDSILHYMEWLGNQKLTRLEISETLFDTTMKPDNDLEKILNINHRVMDIPNQYASFELIADSATCKPGWIHIGDSYYWNISYHIPLDEMFSRHPYWYYNSTIYYDDKHHSTSETDIIWELAETDYISLGYCTSQIYALSSYFAAKTLTNLCFDKKEIHKAIMGIVDNMNNSPEWKASLQQKADNQGKTLDDIMLSDASYMLYLNPEHYFPELNETHPQSRNTLLRMWSTDDPLGNILRNMTHNEEWMNNLKEKAAKQNLDLETIMVNDAKWMLSNRN